MENEEMTKEMQELIENVVDSTDAIVKESKATQMPPLQVYINDLLKRLRDELPKMTEGQLEAIERVVSNEREDRNKWNL